MKKTHKILIAVYVAAAVITFGHCTNNERIPGEAWASCAFFIAAGWPLYWSWVAFNHGGDR